jgi:hypothetical protein
MVQRLSRINLSNVLDEGHRASDELEGKDQTNKEKLVIEWRVSICL